MSVKSIEIYNTASRTIENFKSLEVGKVGIYACGPTVYNYAHLGNLRTYIFEDILCRTFAKFGYDVNHVMNITDVGHLQSDADSGDDKMSIAAKKEKKSPWDIAAAYEKAFFKHTEMLGIKKPDIVCRATDHIPEMIAMIEKLIEKGFAYESNGNVYFDVTKHEDYVSFANLNIEDQRATERVESDASKLNPADFVLWFSNSKFPNQIMKWESPWGIGFPGWHIECSAMATKYLGEQFDIHCGGVDHIPVHHTNEIAQSDCCHGKRSVQYWMHGEFLTIDNNKMSKSSGSFTTVDTLVKKGISPLAYRYFVLSTHYRANLMFSFEALRNAEKSYLNLIDKVQEWNTEYHQEKMTSLAISDTANEYLNSFTESMVSDLRTPNALQVVWNVARSENITSKEKLYLFREFDAYIGLGFKSADRGELKDEEQILMEQREEARNNKDWAESDRLRDLLLAQGISLKDTKTDTLWTRVKGI